MHILIIYIFFFDNYINYIYYFIVGPTNLSIPSFSFFNPPKSKIKVMWLVTALARQKKARLVQK